MACESPSGAEFRGASLGDKVEEFLECCNSEQLGKYCSRGQQLTSSPGFSRGENVNNAGNGKRKKDGNPARKPQEIAISGSRAIEIIPFLFLAVTLLLRCGVETLILLRTKEGGGAVAASMGQPLSREKREGLVGAHRLPARRWTRDVDVSCRACGRRARRRIRRSRGRQERKRRCRRQL